MHPAVICSLACKSSAIWQYYDAFESNLSFSKIAYGRGVSSLCFYRRFNSIQYAGRIKMVAMQNILSSSSAAQCLQHLKDSADN
jgi:hypothetical protein